MPVNLYKFQCYKDIICSIDVNGTRIASAKGILYSESNDKSNQNPINHKLNWFKILDRNFVPTLTSDKFLNFFEK